MLFRNGLRSGGRSGRGERATIAITVHLIAVAVTAACVDTNFWPVEDTGTGHPVGNSSREFQKYGGAPYYHGGIDVREPPAPGGPWLRSVDSGTVALSFSANPIYHGIVITDPDNTQYGYWHVDSTTITLPVWAAWTGGTTLARDIRIAQIVFWPSCAFHHVHFFRKRPAAETDPMVFVRPNNESAVPTVSDIQLAQNASNVYFAGSPLTVSGDVDIIAEISDSIFTDQHLTGVYNASVKIQRRKRILFLSFWKTVLKIDSIFPKVNKPAAATASTVFKTSGPLVSSSNYCGTEVYYYVMTNGVESGYNDANGFWDTDGGSFPNGEYRIKVRAWDAHGNHHERTTLVTVNN